MRNHARLKNEVKWHGPYLVMKLRNWDTVQLYHPVKKEAYPHLVNVDDLKLAYREDNAPMKKLWARPTYSGQKLDTEVEDALDNSDTSTMPTYNPPTHANMPSPLRVQTVPAKTTTTRTVVPAKTTIAGPKLVTKVTAPPTTAKGLPKSSPTTLTGIARNPIPTAKTYFPTKESRAKIILAATPPKPAAVPLTDVTKPSVVPTVGIEPSTLEPRATRAATRLLGPPVRVTTQSRTPAI